MAKVVQVFGTCASTQVNSKVIGSLSLEASQAYLPHAKALVHKGNVGEKRTRLCRIVNYG